MEKLNIVFVFADQMRGQDVECLGESDVKTPNLNKLADCGCIFKNAFSNTPVCTPARGSILTGLYSFSHLAIANDLPVRKDIESIATILKRYGYKTGYIGKWHLDGVPRDKFIKKENRLGFEKWAGWECDHRYFQTEYHTDTPEKIKINGYAPEFQTKLAIDFIEENKENPFVLFVSYEPPHEPYNQVPEKFKIYNPEKIKLRENVVTDKVNVEKVKEIISFYYSAITGLDFYTGEIIKALERNKIREKTIFVFTSDHGDMLFSQGMEKKESPWEESIRIPFIINCPGYIPEKFVSDCLISSVDFVPTLLGLLGIKEGYKFEGVDLSEFIKGVSEEKQKDVLIHVPVPVDQAVEQGIKEWFGIRTYEYTYAENSDGEWLIYNNIEDPFQLVNLAGKEKEIGEKLRNLMYEKMKKFNIEFLPWQEQIKKYGLVEKWNKREEYMHPGKPRVIRREI